MFLNSAELHKRYASGTGKHLTTALSLLHFFFLISHWTHMHTHTTVIARVMSDEKKKGYKPQTLDSEYQN